MTVRPAPPPSSDHTLRYHHDTNLTFVCDERSPEVDLTSSVGLLPIAFLNIGKVGYDGDGVVESTTTAYSCDGQFTEHTGEG